MEWTDRHYRYLARLLSSKTQLWTEMVVDDTLLHSPLAAGYLRFHPAEHPVVCQLGGSDPAKLAAAARMVEAAGYDEVNLNCGCPSDRVAGKGAFGARLMFSPALVRDCCAAMRAAVSIPVSVKCRLGADGMDSYEEFADFISVVAQSGCTSFVVHARKCHLKGLSPKENRTVPPLRYDWVRRAAADFPHLNFGLNGGVGSVAHAAELLAPAEVDPTAPLSSCSAVRRLQRGGRKGLSEGGVEEVGGCCGGGGEEGEVGLAGPSTAPTLLQPLPSPSPPPQSFSGAAGDAAGGGSGYAEAGVAIEASSAVMDSSSSTSVCGVASQELGGAARIDAATLRSAASSTTLDDASSAATASTAGGDGAPPTTALVTVRLASVMMGRVAYTNPWCLAEVDAVLFGVATAPPLALTRRTVIASYLEYADAVVDSVPDEERRLTLYKPFEIGKPLFNLFAGCRGAAKWRQRLQDGLTIQKLSVRDAVTVAMAELEEGTLDATPGAVAPPVASTSSSIVAAAAGVGGAGPIDSIAPVFCAAAMMVE